MTATAVVDVKPAVKSKINWTAAIGLIAGLGAFFGLDVTPETLAIIETGIVALMGVIIPIFRTWFTKSVTPSSV